jgi:2Fe-2S ferredoxin
MPAITFLQPSGQAHTVDAYEHESAMEAAVQSAVPGIVAECGGNTMCATCHVYVDEKWRSRLPGMSDREDALLAAVAAERRDTSRLSCQIRLTSALDGLVLHIPEKQV